MEKVIIKGVGYEIELTQDDIIVYNGACYLIRTRVIGKGWNKHPPLVAKAKAEKLIKDGMIVEVKRKDGIHTGNILIYYKLAGGVDTHE